MSIFCKCQYSENNSATKMSPNFGLQSETDEMAGSEKLWWYIILGMIVADLWLSGPK
jgi:hypothetical protein